MPINDAVYEEVVRIVLDAKQALADVNTIGAQLSSNLAKAMRQGELKVFKDAADFRKQVELEVQREIERVKIEQGKEVYRRQLGMSKQLAQEEHAIAKELHRYRLDGSKATAQEERAIAKSLHKYRLDFSKATAREEREVAKSLHSYRLHASKEQASAAKAAATAAAQHEHVVAKALHQYRLAGIKERQHAEEAAIKATARAFEAQEQRKAEFARRYNTFRGEQSALNNQPSFMQKMGQTGNALRVGAAVSGATGNFQLAAGFYGLERVAAQAGMAEKSLLKVGAGFAALGVAAAVAGTAIWTMFKGHAFNEALHDMGTLLSEVNENDLTKFNAKLDQLALSAVKVSVAFNSNLIDVVKGFKTALSSGIEAEELEQFSMIVGNVSTALGTSFDQTTNILTSFKDAYNLSIGQMSAVGDKLFRLVDVGKVNVQELMASFGRLIPIAANAGVSITDAFAGVATLSRTGMSTSQSVTALTQLISKIVNPSDKAKRAFQSLGIQFGAAAFAGRTLSEVISEIQEKTAGKGDAIGQIFPEERAKRGAAGLRSVLDLLKKSALEIENSEGAAARASVAKMDTFATKMGQLNKVMMGTVAIVGKDLLEVLNKVFFGSGGFSEAKLKQLEITFEKVGQFVSGIATGLIIVTNIVVDLVAGIGHLLVSMSKFATMDIAGAREAWNASDAAVRHLFTGTMEAANGYIDTLNKSGTRIAILREEIVAMADTVGDATDPFVQMDLAAARAGEEILTLTDRQEQLLDSRVGDKATSFEKQTLAMYEGQITKLEQILDLKSRIASAFATEVVNKQMPNAPMKVKAGLQRSIMATELKAGGGDELLAGINSFADHITTLKKKIDARAFTAEQTNAWGSLTGVLGKVWSDFGEAAHKLAVDKVEKFNKAVTGKAEQIYKSDVDAYEKAQQEKLSYLKKIYSDMEAAGNKNAAIMADIQSELASNALSGEGNPDRRKRIAEKQMTAAKEELSGSPSSEGAKGAYERYKAGGAKLCWGYVWSTRFSAGYW